MKNQPEIYNLPSATELNSFPWLARYPDMLVEDIIRSVLSQDTDADVQAIKFEAPPQITTTTDSSGAVATQQISFPTQVLVLHNTGSYWRHNATYEYTYDAGEQKAHFQGLVLRSEELS